MRSYRNFRRDLRPPVLTPRQRRVLRLVAQGLTSEEIGRRLRISPRTVQVHRSHAMEVLDVRNAVQLIRKAMAYRLLTPRHLGVPERRRSSRAARRWGASRRSTRRR